jgi:hypothetical protein
MQTPNRISVSGASTPLSSRTNQTINSHTAATHAEVELDLFARSKSTSAATLKASLKVLTGQVQSLQLSLPNELSTSTLDTEIRMSTIGSSLITLLTQLFQHDPHWAKTVTIDFPYDSVLAKYQAVIQNTAVKLSQAQAHIKSSPAQYKVDSAHHRARMDMECAAEEAEFIQQADELRYGPNNTAAFLAQIMDAFYGSQTSGYRTPCLKLFLPRDDYLIPVTVVDEFDHTQTHLNTAAQTPDQQANARHARAELSKLEAKHRKDLAKVETPGNYNFFTLLNGRPFTPPVQRAAATRRAARKTTAGESPDVGDDADYPVAHDRAEAAFAAEKDVFLKRIRAKYALAHIHFLDQEETAAKELAEAQALVQDLTELQVAHSNMTELLSAYQRSNLQIVQAIQRELASETPIVQRLNSGFTHSFTGASHSRALTNGHLCWVWDLLNQSFKVPKVHVMLQSLLEIISDASKPPPPVNVVSNQAYLTQIMQEEDAHISTWRSLEFWQYMTPDIFFSCITILRVKKGSLKADLLKILTDAIETSQQTAEVSIALGPLSLSDPMPILDAINQKLRTEAASGALSALTTPPRNENRDRGRGGGGRQHRQQPEHRPPHDPGLPTGLPAGHEHAHVAEIPAGVTVLTKNDRNMVGKTFVKHGDKFWYPYVRDGNTAYASYTATSDPCKQCYPNGSTAGQKADPKSSHKPFCYGGQCGRCSLYGHRVCFNPQKKKQSINALQAAADDHHDGDDG